LAAISRLQVGEAGADEGDREAASADRLKAMQMAASACVLRLCISSIMKRALDWLVLATSPIPSSSSVRSCSGSPESATPEAASTSSLSWIAPGTQC
jgi:hypothetical protein